MKIARLSLDQGPRFAVLDEESRSYLVLSDDPLFGKIEATGQRVGVDDAHLVAPMIPRSKVVGYIGAYSGGTEGSDPSAPSTRTPDELTRFIKPNTSVIGPDDPIVLPRWARGVRHEPELAVVISRACKDVPASRVKDVVFGYTVANDVTAEADDKVRAKCFDTSSPIGPVIETDLDVAGLDLVSRVDGEERTVGSTASLSFSVAELVAHASTIFTLLPGDIILTGAPAGVGEIEAGQVVEVECEGIGVLRNPVLRRD